MKARRTAMGGLVALLLVACALVGVRPAAAGASLAGRVIAIDPGHNIGNFTHGTEINRPVFVGNGDKPCNTTGTSTDAGYPESLFALKVAEALTRELQARGATVRMTRYTEDPNGWGPCVDARGRFGAYAGAELMISLHGDGTSSALHGFHVIRPGLVPGYTDDIVASSAVLQDAVRARLRDAGFVYANYYGGTGAVERTDLGTLNMSDVPTVMTELGNMRNPADAAMMTSAAGQARLAAALAAGVDTFLGGRPRPRRTRSDFDGDGRTDLAVWRPSTGVWWLRGGPAVLWGEPGDVPVPGDFDGDGRTDLAVWRPSTGVWWLRGGPAVLWGEPGDVPVPRDFDGDGRTDLAVWRPSTGVWWLRGGPAVLWGEPGDVPVPGDFDGDGRTDLAVWRPSTGVWWLRGGPAVLWGEPGDVPVPGDFDGDGRTDLAVWRPSTGVWWLRGGPAVLWGEPGDVPVPGDFDGDGRADLAVWRRGTGVWWLRGAPTVLWGEPRDVPVS